MTETMIERVGLAIFAELEFQAQEQDMTVQGNMNDALLDGRTFDLSKVAKAAIEAMREPTEAMKIEGADVWEQENQAVAAVYRAMIDEALGEN